ncbi:hypothetical protein AKJ16_DCAP17477 [Drosera capensis]
MANREDDDSDAPEEFTSEQGKLRDQEIIKVQRENKARFALCLFDGERVDELESWRCAASSSGGLCLRRSLISRSDMYLSQAVGASAVCLMTYFRCSLENTLADVKIDNRQLLQTREPTRQ